MTLHPDPNQTRTAAPMAARMGGLRPNRVFIALALLIAALIPGTLGEVTQATLVDAYIGVSVFVAGTLMLFYGAEKLFKFNLGEVLKGAKWAQVPLASLMGALPGCGGAVVVVAAYSSGNVGMGAVVATLTATMGDAAFLLIATRPDAALVVLPLAFSVGLISGWVVDKFDRTSLAPAAIATQQLAPRIGDKLRLKDMAYGLLVLPGLVFGIADVAGMEFSALADNVVFWMAMAATAIGLWVWASSPVKAMTNASDRPLTRMTEETAFIAVWVIGAFLAFEYVVAFTGLDLAGLFQAVGWALPLIAILVGFIPGCGPQILVTTLYINGLIPFAALIGNVISNDGDALFPAIALNPRAAVIATLYSAIPAFIVAYGFYTLAPGFMN
ncbi:MAG: putative manganese transporter [Pseudomonadota bacterium]